MSDLYQEISKDDLLDVANYAEGIPHSIYKGDGAVVHTSFEGIQVYQPDMHAHQQLKVRDKLDLHKIVLLQDCNIVMKEKSWDGLWGAYYMGKKKLILITKHEDKNIVTVLALSKHLKDPRHV